jgi:hypothetical protein
MKATPGSELQLSKSDMCDRCATIVWKKPPRYLSSESYHICTLHETVEELLASDCRICRMLGMSVPEPHEAIPPIEVTWHDFVGIRLKSGRIKPLRAFGMTTDSYIDFYERPVPHKNTRTTKVDLQTDSIKQWLKQCRYTHGKCVPNQNNPLPGLKVIDCHQSCVTLAPTSCSYVAISYVWGQAVKYEELDSSISDVNLPQTIKASIHVTMLLGYRYLWIDKYVCLPNLRSERD